MSEKLAVPHSIKEILDRGFPFITLYLVYFVFGLYLNLGFSQKEIFFFINNRHQAFEDPLMEYYTNVGDGIFCIMVFLVLSIKKVRYTLIGLVAWSLQGIIVQVMKRLIFPDHVRPWKEFSHHIYLVKNFTPFTNNSFPSGHSATAFCLFFLLSLLFNRRWYSIVFFFLALGVTYSRIYLSQHFFIDTYVGSIIGVFSAFVIYSYFYSPSRVFNRQLTWLDKPVQRLKG